MAKIYYSNGVWKVNLRGNLKDAQIEINNWYNNLLQKAIKINQFEIKQSKIITKVR